MIIEPYVYCREKIITLSDTENLIRKHQSDLDMDGEQS